MTNTLHEDIARNFTTNVRGEETRRGRERGEGVGG